jgi:murein DD-endopeptidase MepM/ murein hydrolase activator NlpD
MAHKASLILLDRYGSKIKHLNIASKHLTAVAAAILVLIGLTLYGGFSYLRLHSKNSAAQQLEAKMLEKEQEVALQRDQIQKFAQEINGLKERLGELNQFEERLRLLANLKQDENDEVFGIGGSAPEELDPSLELDQSHRRLIKDMHKQIKHLDEATQAQQDVFADLIQRMEERKNMLAHMPAIRPSQGWISSAFAYRRSPFTGKREMHRGIDIANHAGSPIWATADGTISFAGQNGGMGLMLVIDHGYGIVTRYAHLQKALVKRGDRVRRGDNIALMGNTGRSTGPHLHYEVRVNGMPVNPQKYILN